MNYFSKSYLLTIIAFGLFLNSFSQVTLKQGFVHELVMGNLDQPTCIAIAPEGRIFITEKGGKVNIIEDGVLLAEPFVELEVETSGEQGISSIRLDPNFETNGYVYIYYTVPVIRKNRLSRFTAAGNRAVDGSELIIQEFDELHSIIHQGGTIRFVNDTTFLVSTGDGANGSTAQSHANLLGKMCRFHSDGSIPTDNPFYDTNNDQYRAIFALGFRNPFTFDINRQTGQVFICDVGGNDFEEINDVEAGMNYGWPIIEGEISGEIPPENYRDPIFSYPHINNQCAVVGAAFYAPLQTKFPESFHGKFFFSDYCSNQLVVLDPTNGEVTDTLASGIPQITNLTVSDEGDLYYLRFGSGELYKVLYTGSGAPFITKNPESDLYSVGDQFSSSVEAVGDSPLSYEWYLNNTLQSDQQDNIFTINNIQLADSGSTLFCIVKNDLGQINSDTIIINVTANMRPNPQINTSTNLYSNGDTIRFAGSATDHEDGTIPPESLSWKVDFHHDEHTHPALPWTSGMDHGELVIPRLGEVDTNVWYRVYLSAEDSYGLTNETFINYLPIKTNFLVKSTPGPFNVKVDGETHHTTSNIRSVNGNTRVLYAPFEQIRNDSLFEFVEWVGHNSTNPIYINAGDDTEYTCVYEYVKPYYEGNGNGLLANYYPNLNFEAPARIVRIDPQIDFEWSWWKPMLDSSTTRWEGFLLAPITGTYTFHMQYDDRARVVIDSAEVFNDETNVNSIGKGSFEIDLIAGQFYQINVEHTDFYWESQISMKWEYEGQTLQFVPQRYLYTDTLILDTSNNGSEFEATFYPNPVAHSLIVKTNRLITDKGDIALFVYAADGQKFEVPYSVSAHNLILNMSRLKTGVYYVSYSSSSHGSTKGVIYKK